MSLMSRMRDNIPKYHDGFGLFLLLNKTFLMKDSDLNESEIYEISYL